MNVQIDASGFELLPIGIAPFGVLVAFGFLLILLGLIGADDEGDPPSGVA